ncbi:MAG: DMT family transporter [Pirellulaceae bacterium]|nr:DMT family transporter [Pirellulaceae bacterium]
MSQPTSLAHDAAQPSVLLISTTCGLLSAIGYTGANGFLRAVAHCDPVWVSAVKAFPNILLVGPWLLALHFRGLPVLPARSVLVKIALAGLVGQVFGNVLFQWSLGVIGLALAVPLCLGTIILGGALLGRIVLNEPLTVRTLFSVGLLIGAISVLSLGAGEAQQSVAATLGNVSPADSWWRLAAGVAAATFSGLAYAVLGVVIRYGVSGRASLAATIFIVGLAGAISLGSLTLWKIGWEGVMATRSDDLVMMLLAGLLNTAAFFALTKAFQLASIVYVNALNATQATMSAIVGVLLFQEAFSPELVLGVVLTIAGLVLMKR